MISITFFDRTLRDFLELLPILSDYGLKQMTSRYTQHYHLHFIKFEEKTACLLQNFNLKQA